jgi:Fic family protein
MLVPALLYYQGSLSAPVLYTSEYFERMSVEYRSKLHEVDQTGNITPWLVFFLRSLKEQCVISIDLVDKILALNDSLHDYYKGSHSPNMTKLIDFIFERPAFSIPNIVSTIGISRLTATSLVRRLEQDGMVEYFPDTKGPHNALIYIFPGLLALII